MNDSHNLDSLDQLLEKERACLLKGDLEGLGGLLPEKETVIEQLLAQGAMNSEAVAPLEQKLRRNQLLLDGALDGIRTVAARLAALKQVRSTLDTYDAHGRRKSAATAQEGTLEKRA